MHKEATGLTKIWNSCNGFQDKEPCTVSFVIQNIKYLYHRILQKSVILCTHLKKSRLSPPGTNAPQHSNKTRSTKEIFIKNGSNRMLRKRV